MKQNLIPYTLTVFSKLPYKVLFYMLTQWPLKESIHQVHSNVGIGNFCFSIRIISIGQTCSSLNFKMTENNSYKIIILILEYFKDQLLLNAKITAILPYNMHFYATTNVFKRENV